MCEKQSTGNAGKTKSPAVVKTKSQARKIGQLKERDWKKSYRRRKKWLKPSDRKV